MGFPVDQIQGNWPNVTCQDYGHYDYLPGGISHDFTDAIYNNSQNQIIVADPSQSGVTGFSKIIAGDTISADSLVNYRGYTIRIDSISWFRYLAGEFLVTFPDTTLEPVGFALIPDTMDCFYEIRR